ncbi:N-acetylmuramic acid-6-phosphate etherase [Candidatus Magnetoovum chiemensis]|nr:N-acetylmuramic acid-6-phosphate etherase [Candidatus Magnetoovum chiemensis]
MYTENINPKSAELDALSVEGIIDLMSEEDLKVVEAVRAAKEAIAKAVKDAVNRIKLGGGVIYIGAGTSGRLGVLDASEMPPTFSVPPSIIKAIIAGGTDALTTSVEGAEDNIEAAKEAVKDVTSLDMVLGITASGGAPFVITALQDCKNKGASAWLLTCNDTSYDFLDGTIRIITGAEIIGGSTRLKAGTATKMALNMLSTSIMISLGRVYKGYMVDVVPLNKKLVNRAVKIIEQITGCAHNEAAELLDKSKGNPKTAILMYLKGLSCEEAVERLKQCDGFLRKALQM